MDKKPVTIDEYISQFPNDIQELLEIIRFTIAKAAPKATEVISYSTPAFKMNKVLVWFAGYKNHIGFYPSAAPIEIFREELSIYKTSKGAIQFPISHPLPLKLITKIVKHQVKASSFKIKKG